MIYLILSLIGFIAYGLYLGQDIFEKFLYVISGSVIGFLFGCLFWFIVGGIIGSNLPTEYIVLEEQEIIALTDSSNLNGKFFLGTGSVGEKDFYKYVYKKDGVKIVKTISSSEYSTIGIVDEQYNGTPKYIIEQKDFKNEFYFWFALPSLKKKITFYVPENTVTSDFTIDLK